MCSPADAMVLVPDQIDPIKIIEDPDRVGVMRNYKSHKIINWGESGCQYVYTLSNGREIIERWVELNYMDRHFRYSYDPSNLDPELGEFLESIEGNMKFKDMANDPFGRMNKSTH